MIGHCARTLGPAAHKSLSEASCRQAAHAALEKLERVSHVHFTNLEVLASLRLEIDGDDAATAFVGKARGAETWLSIIERSCS